MSRNLNGVIHGAKNAAWNASPEEAAAYKALKEALDAEARMHWNDPTWLAEVAADMTSQLDYGFTYENLFSTYFNVETVGEFDRVVLRERRGLKVFYTSRGGEIEESQLKTEEWELPRDTLGFHVSEHEDKLRANFSNTVEDLVGLGEERMDAEVNRRIFSLLQAAIPSNSAYYVNASGGITKQIVDQALREVRDAIKPNGEGPAPVTIMGRLAVVDTISDFNLGFDPEATQEIRNKGRLGVYRAANVNAIINYTDEDGASYIPANELWVFGGNVGKFALYGGMQNKNFKENTAWYWHYLGRKDIGGLIHHPEQARRIVDGTIAP